MQLYSPRVADLQPEVDYEYEDLIKIRMLSVSIKWLFGICHKEYYIC